MLYLVRHAKAGSRSAWEGDDRDRPLSRAGAAQAAAIAERWSGPERLDPPSTLLSSDSLRCRQTLEPLAGLVGLDIGIDGRLREGTAFEGTVELLGEVPDGTVMCSHGDVIPDAIAALERRGCTVHGTADWRKGTVWAIDRRGGEFVGARVWSPPSSRHVTARR